MTYKQIIQAVVVEKAYERFTNGSIDIVQCVNNYISKSDMLRQYKPFNFKRNAALLTDDSYIFKLWLAINIPKLLPTDLEAQENADEAEIARQGRAVNRHLTRMYNNFMPFISNYIKDYKSFCNLCRVFYAKSVDIGEMYASIVAVKNLLNVLFITDLLLNSEYYNAQVRDKLLIALLTANYGLLTRNMVVDGKEVIVNA